MFDQPSQPVYTRLNIMLAVSIKSFSSIFTRQFHTVLVDAVSSSSSKQQRLHSFLLLAGREPSSELRKLDPPSCKFKSPT